jgi:hypothetical protein
MYSVPEAYIRTLIGYAYPAAEDLPTSLTLFRRRWVVRLQRPVTDAGALKSTLEKICNIAKDAIREVYGVEAMTPENVPCVGGVAIGENYLVLEIDCPKPGFAIGDSATIGTWTILRSVDTEWTIVDLEGIPKEFWFPLVS